MWLRNELSSLAEVPLHFIKVYSITTYSRVSIPTGQSIPLKMFLAPHAAICLILRTYVKTYFGPWCLSLIPLEISFEYHVLHSHGRKTSLSTTCPKSWEGPYICHNRRHQSSPFCLLCQQLIYCSWWRVPRLHLRLVEHCAQLRSATLNSTEIWTSVAIYAGVKWNTNLMQHCAGFISAESLYMFRAQAPIIRSI